MNESRRLFVQDQQGSLRGVFGQVRLLELRPAHAVNHGCVPALQFTEGLTLWLSGVLPYKLLVSSIDSRGIGC
jgi:hypothetical protein